MPGALGEHVLEPRPPQRRGAPAAARGARSPAEDARRPRRAAWPCRTRGAGLPSVSTAIAKRCAAPLEERRLVHQPPGGGAAPAALEERPEAGPLRVAREAPALRGHDRREQVPGVGAVAARHEPVDPQEEARLVDRRDARGGPVPGGPEVAHVRAPGHPQQPGVADVRVDGVGAVVVGALDHRVEQSPLGRPWARAGRSRGGRPRASSPWSRSPTRRPAAEPSRRPGRASPRARTTRCPSGAPGSGGRRRPACVRETAAARRPARPPRVRARACRAVPRRPWHPGGGRPRRGPRRPRAGGTPPGASRHGGRRARRLEVAVLADGDHARMGAAGEHARVDGEQAVRVARRRPRRARARGGPRRG